MEDPGSQSLILQFLLLLILTLCNAFFSATETVSYTHLTLPTKA